MKSFSGASAPFSLALQLPRLRDDALLQRAIANFQADDLLGAVLDAEAACRRNPRSVPPALLRAKLLQFSGSSLAGKASFLAWSREPTHPVLQDALLETLTAMGAQDTVRALGLCFLPQRVQAGTAGKLIESLKAVSSVPFGACWSEGSTIVLAAYSQVNIWAGDQNSLNSVSVEVTGEREVLSVAVPTNGSPERLVLPQCDGVWSIAFANTGLNTTLLQGSPLVWRSGLLNYRPTNLQTVSRPVARPLAKRARAPTVGRSVNVVIPVFADQTLTKACVTSVLNSLNANQTRVVVTVVDDASPDSELSAWLADLSMKGSIELIRNHHNLGFIESCNRAMNVWLQSDVLLLNADTLVQGDWIDRLCEALHASEDIASVTPWSNNGEISSFPVIGKSGVMPSLDQLRLIDTTVARLHRTKKVVDVGIPSGCGFAMMLRRSALEQVGLLDGVALKRGYGEEVDWCLRAGAAGYRHLLATAVFVAHSGTASFGYEKTLRAAQNQKVIQARYPFFYSRYRQFLKDDPIKTQRSLMVAALASADCSWLKTCEASAAIAKSIPDYLPAAVPSQTRYIGVWKYNAATQGAKAVLALARALASRKATQSKVRILIFGTPSESLWHTGVVNALPEAPSRDSGLLNDGVLLGLTGCDEILCDEDIALPVGISLTRLDRSFEPRRWLNQWLLRQNLTLHT